MFKLCKRINASANGLDFDLITTEPAQFNLTRFELPLCPVRVLAEVAAI